MGCYVHLSFAYRETQKSQNFSHPSTRSLSNDWPNPAVVSVRLLCQHHLHGDICRRAQGSGGQSNGHLRCLPRIRAPSRRVGLKDRRSAQGFASPSSALLKRGRYQRRDSPTQAVRPLLLKSSRRSGGQAVLPVAEQSLPGQKADGSILTRISPVLWIMH